MEISLEQLYLDREGTVDFDTTDDLDNIQSMQLFLEHNNLHKNIINDDGTQVFLYNGKSNEVVVLNSRGRGDFYSHAIDYHVEIISEQFSPEELMVLERMRVEGDLDEL